MMASLERSTEALKPGRRLTGTASKVGSRLLTREPIYVALFLGVVFFVAFQGLSIIETENRSAAGKALRTLVHSMEESLHLWSRNRIEDARSLAVRPDLIQVTKSLLALPRTRQTLLNENGLQAAVRESLRAELEVQGYLGFFIIAPDRVSLGSMRDANVGNRNLIAEQRGELLDRVFEGESLIIPTLVSDVPLNTRDGNRNAVPPTMFAATPIQDEDGTVLAAFAIRLDPVRDFSRLMRLGRIGDSGETYAFDRNGLMLTESRYEEQLRTLGILRVGEHSVLNVRIAEPGVDLTRGLVAQAAPEDRPLTLMARRALSDGTGHNVSGYSDYRGVTVLGAWTWDPDLGFGLATEIAENEALESYYTARNVVLGSLGLVTLLSVLLTLHLTGLRDRAVQELEKNQAALEDRVHERTQNLMQVNDRLQEQFEERIRAEEQLKLAHDRLEETNAKLEELATIDGLTGIPNRRSFDQNLNSEWNRCLRQGLPISLAMLDIDFFKPYNDTLGHQSGDACLQKIGEILNSSKYARRPGDMAARYGGEEFGIILCDTDLRSAASIAESIRLDVLNAAIPHPATRIPDTDKVTVSIGVASLLPSVGQSPDAIIHLADQALYDAKNLGRNRVVIAA